MGLAEACKAWRCALGIGGVGRMTKGKNKKKK